MCGWQLEEEDSACGGESRSQVAQVAPLDQVEYTEAYGNSDCKSSRRGSSMSCSHWLVLESDLAGATSRCH